MTKTDIKKGNKIKYILLKGPLCAYDEATIKGLTGIEFHLVKKNSENNIIIILLKFKR